MKLQVAIDRVPLKEAKELVEKLNEADIIELGTSLCKDYGLACIEETKHLKKDSKLLVDIKTIDEGKYEFEQYFEAGADILTVMGASAPETIDICYQVTERYNKEMLIDLLECSDERIEAIAQYENAIYGMHFAKDSTKEVSLVEEVNRFTKKFPQIKRVALAGSLNLEKVKELQGTGLEIAIVGSSIVKHDNPQTKMKKYLEVLK